MPVKHEIHLIFPDFIHVYILMFMVKLNVKVDKEAEPHAQWPFLSPDHPPSSQLEGIYLTLFTAAKLSSGEWESFRNEHNSKKMRLKRAFCLGLWKSPCP